jgi:hypothetical protein
VFGWGPRLPQTPHRINDTVGHPTPSTVRLEFDYPQFFQKLTAGLCRLTGGGKFGFLRRHPPIPPYAKIIPDRTPVDRNAISALIPLFIGPERIQKRPIFGP